MEDFYAWLQKNEERFHTGYEIDLREASKFNIYPVFANGNSYVYLTSSSYGMLYNDLYIGLDQMKYYLSEYKGRDISGIYFVLSPDVTVAVYDASGNLLRCVTTSYETSTEVDLTDASYIKLMGEGKLTFFQLEGYDNSVA